MTSDRRLHRAGIAVSATEDLRGALVPVLVLGVVSGGLESVAQTIERLLVFGALGVVMAAVFGYIRWSTTTYRVGDGAVRLRSGVFQRNEKSIPLDRLQSVDVSEGPVQRLLGVRQVRLQAAGSGRGAEIALNALSADDVADLRAALAQAPALHEPEAGPAAGAARRLSTGRLLLAGVTSAQFGFVIPIAAAAGQAVDDLSDPLIDWLREGGESASAGAIAGALGAVLAAAWLVAFAGTLIGFGGFSITRQGDRLTIERGYVIRRAASVPVARVQAVRLVDGLLRQPLGLTQLRVETAGYADERADAQTLFPLMRRDEVAAFLGHFLPELAAPVDPLTPPPRRARRRYVMWPALAGLAAGGALAIGAAGWPLAIAGAGLGAAWGLLRFRAAGLALPAGSLVVRSRRLARTTVVARRTSVDIRRATQNPLQRRSDLASVRFAIASGHRFGVAHVDRREAVGALVTLARGGRP